MFGLEPNELALVVFLAVLITVSGWLPRLGEWLGEFAGGFAKGMKQSGSERPPRRSKPPKPAPARPESGDPDKPPPAG